MSPIATAAVEHSSSD